MKNSESESLALSSFQELIKKRKLRFTTERKNLVKQILKMKGHFDSESLYEKLKGKQLSVSRDTVFRTLPLLLESGLLQKSVGSGRGEFFEVTPSKGHHDHMVCIRCQKVIEFSSDALENLQHQLCDDYEFTLVFHDHRLFGYCKGCR